MKQRKKYFNKSRIKMKAYKLYKPKGKERRKRGGDSIIVDGKVYMLRDEGMKMIIDQPSYKLSNGGSFVTGTSKPFSFGCIQALPPAWF